MILETPAGYYTIDEEKYYVANGMEKYGGSFVESLGIALRHADMINTRKIKDTWPEYWKQYLEMGLVYSTKMDN